MFGVKLIMGDKGESFANRDDIARMILHASLNGGEAERVIP